MNRRRFIRTAFVCSVLCLGAPANSWQVPYEGQERVLRIGVQPRGSAPMTEAETVFRQVLNDALASRLDFYVEHIDVDRFAEEQYQSTVAEFLRRKYDGLRIDLVIATTTSVIQLLEHSRPELFHDSTFVFMAEVPFQPTPKATGIYSGLDMRGTLTWRSAAAADEARLRDRRSVRVRPRLRKLARQQFQSSKGGWRSPTSPGCR